MEGLKYLIESAFDSSGFDEAKDSIARLDNASEELGLSTDELSDRVESLDGFMMDNAGNIKDSEGKFTDMGEAMDALGSEQAAVAAAADEMGKSQEFVREQLDRTNMVMHETAEGSSQFRDMTTGSFKESAEAGEEMTDMLQTFEFEALSAMFAAMAVSRTVQDLTDPAMESAGVFQVISDTLEIFFLPAAMMVLDAVLKMQEFFLGLPKPVQKFIGVLAVLIIVIGNIIGALAILALNTGITFGGMIRFVTSFLSKFKIVGSAVLYIVGLIKAAFVAVASAVGISVGALVAVIAVIVAAVAGLWYAWSNNLFAIRQKVGKFVQFVGKNFKTIAKIMFLPLEPLNMIIKAINRLTGKSLPTVDDVLNDVGDSIEEMGKGFEESGNKMDKMKEKAPDKKKQGFIQKFMPGNDGKKSEAKGTTQSGMGSKTDIKNKFEIKGASNMDERKLAREIGKRQKEVKDKSVRKR